jgi:hypothetical protein
MMTISNIPGYGISPQPPERPRSSAWDGLTGYVGGYGSGLALGTGAVVVAERFKKPEQRAFHNAVNSNFKGQGFKAEVGNLFRSVEGNNATFLDKTSNLGSKVGSQFGKFSEAIGQNSKVKPIILGTATALGVFGLAKGILGANNHNNELVGRLQLENSVLSTQPMGTIF